MSASSTYCYASLEDPPRQFRLLELNASTDQGSILTGNLSIHRILLRNRISGTKLVGKQFALASYFAGSYVWGTGPDLDTNHEIILDGRRFLNSASLHTGLRIGRAEATSKIRIWVDAICINQVNIHEKSAQIAIMPDIYHSAAAVFVWLGPLRTEYDRVTRFMKQLTMSDFLLNCKDYAHNIMKTETKYKDKGQSKRPLAGAIAAGTVQLLGKEFVKGTFGLIKGINAVLDIIEDQIEKHEWLAEEDRIPRSLDRG